MKQVVLSLALLAASATAASAQRAHAIKINPVSAAVRTGSLFYEHKVGDNSSAQLGLAITDCRVGASDTKSRLTGITIMPEYRFYLSGEALDGFYLAPFLRFRSFRASDQVWEYDGYTNTDVYVDRRANIMAYGGGAVAGRQWLVADQITLDIYLGLSQNGSFFSTKDNVTAQDFDYDFDGLGIRSGFTLGVAF
jgi:Protein of unknown function (DUF3575)